MPFIIIAQLLILAVLIIQSVILFGMLAYIAEVPPKTLIKHFFSRKPRREKPRKPQVSPSDRTTEHSVPNSSAAGYPAADENIEIEDPVPQNRAAISRASAGSPPYREISSSGSKAANRFVECGLTINNSVYLNPQGAVRFDRAQSDDSIYRLYSDMTVYPSSVCFAAANTPGFFSGHDFSFVYDFIDEDGRAVEIRRMTLLLRTQKPAKVKYVHDYFQLMEKGILVVKEI